MKITIDMLQRIRACPDQVSLFERIWPAGADVTLENARLALVKGLDVGWFFTECCSPAANDACVRGLHAALDDYIAASAAAQAAHDAATAAAQAAYDEARDAAVAAHKAAIARVYCETFEPIAGL